jgi:hypothetical protein
LGILGQHDLELGYGSGSKDKQNKQRKSWMSRKKILGIISERNKIGIGNFHLVT